MVNLRNFKSYISEASSGIPGILGFAKVSVGDGSMLKDPVMRKDIEVVIDLCKSLKAKGITTKSSRENFDHFKAAYAAWHKLNHDRISYYDDTFRTIGRKLASKAGVLAVYDMFIGNPSKTSVRSFCKWAFNTVPNRVGRGTDKTLEHYFKNWKTDKGPFMS
jgi:hypothetical protein